MPATAGDRKSLQCMLTSERSTDDTHAVLAAGEAFRARIVFVTGGLDDALAAQAAAQIMTLDASSDAPIDVVLSSADGTLEAAFVLIDVIDDAHAPIRIR
jgi:ATP-dependent protease ClpP protease subunit